MPPDHPDKLFGFFLTDPVTASLLTIALPTVFVKKIKNIIHGSHGVGGGDRKALKTPYFLKVTISVNI